jgi:hypothetical protein
MRVEDLVLFATNEQELEAIHYSLAKEGKREKWIEHVCNVVIPLYRKKLNEPMDGMTMWDTRRVAARLREIYEDLLQEEAIEAEELKWLSLEAQWLRERM